MTAAELAPHAVLLAALTVLTAFAAREGHRTRRNPTHGQQRPHHRHVGTAADDHTAITQHDKEQHMTQPATDHRPEPWFWGADTDRCPHGPEPEDDATAAWEEWTDRHPGSPQDVRICIDAPMGDHCAECSEDHGAPVPWESCDAHTPAEA